MSDPAGTLQIRIGPNGTSIASSRPVGAAAVFVGRTPGETARLLPALFSICATAQSAACVGALEQAQGHRPVPSVRASRRRLVAAETLREHLWRILLDWPCLLDLQPDTDSMARVMDAYSRLRVDLSGSVDPFELGRSDDVPRLSSARDRLEVLADLVAQRVLGTAPGPWLDSIDGLDALVAWSAKTDTVAARLLRHLLDQDLADLGCSGVQGLPEHEPDLISAELDARLSVPSGKEFVALPRWNGEPHETSPFTRNLDSPLIRDLSARLGNGMLARLAAQLVEVARIASGTEANGEIDADASGPKASGEPDRAQLAPGVGLAQVCAARGLLVHRVELRSGRVADYRILAPTEWNFHPEGVVARGLEAIATRVGGAQLQPLARLFVAAVDPCVQFDVLTN